MAFSTEEVARAVAGSRVPTIVGVGHEIDVSLADMAADVRATTPTNAAQLVVPDRVEVAARIDYMVSRIGDRMSVELRARLDSLCDRLVASVENMLSDASVRLDSAQQKLELVNPANVMKRGYSLVTDGKGNVVRSAKDIQAGDDVMLRFNKGTARAEVKDVKN